MSPADGLPYPVRARSQGYFLPPLSFDEAPKATKLYPIAGQALLARRWHGEACAPRHPISDAGLIGGGSVPRAGEVSLGHLGVLFLDELSEFRRDALEALRHLREDRVAADLDHWWRATGRFRAAEALLHACRIEPVHQSPVRAAVMEPVAATPVRVHARQLSDG